MGLAGDVGGLVVVGAGINIIGHTVSKDAPKWKKAMKGWHGESARHSEAKLYSKYKIKTKKKVK